jgi:hypothetical protein
VSNPTPIQRVAISAFILFNLVAILCWALPVDTKLFPAVNRHTSIYMNMAGLTQGWSLFAPDPPDSNCRLGAEITHDDGSTNLWNFPVPQDYGHSYFLERDRKWANDSLRLDRKSVLWPDAARYIARINDNPMHHSVSVKLLRNCEPIPVPGAKPLAAPNPPKPVVFFTYAVEPGDLK